MARLTIVNNESADILRILKSGFATTQAAHEEAFRDVFAILGLLN